MLWITLDDITKLVNNRLSSISNANNLSFDKDFLIKFLNKESLSILGAGKLEWNFLFAVTRERNELISKEGGNLWSTILLRLLVSSVIKPG